MKIKNKKKTKKKHFRKLGQLKKKLNEKRKVQSIMYNNMAPFILERKTLDISEML